jgi:magnesium chelatase subunit I
MADLSPVPILPFSYIVGQHALRMALELVYVNPAVGGVLLSGERGTAKSTTVRAFALMMYGQLPVTLPVNATDDRVLGGWDIEALMRGESRRRPGLLQDADTKLLYIDEVNLLDDHLVNIILDVTAMNVLVVQQDGIDQPALPVSFTLVGTMNPEEGGLRPQLLDRFGLMVPVYTETSPGRRAEILRTVLRFEQERMNHQSAWLSAGHVADGQRATLLNRAREWLPQVDADDAVLQLCARVAVEFDVEGHRGEQVMVAAARARAAIADQPVVRRSDVAAVVAAAPYAVMHRRRNLYQGEDIPWQGADDKALAALTGTDIDRPER